MYDQRDNSTLTYLEDDGKPIEPEYYMPVLPMILVNGAEGIGTGYSTQVPCYNPADIKANINAVIAGESLKPMTPWYKGFTGTVYKKSDTTWVMGGTFKEAANGTITITELPPGKWTQDYKEFLDVQVEKGKIKYYDNHSTEDHPKFTIHGFTGNDPRKDLGLTKNINTGNMWLMTPTGMKKYATAEAIIADYVGYRVKHYKQRKINMLKDFKAQAAVASNKARFVRMVVNGDFIVFKRKRVDIDKDLLNHKFQKYQGNYEYLMNIKTSQYTEESISRLNAEESEKKSQVTELEKLSFKDLWVNDLKNIK
jgi:DNA topoisomerase-2|tara:strand:- start:247 stop:1176 length:930 start_codon:yes stop_codon:yes gene_type:complete